MANAAFTCYDNDLIDTDHGIIVDVDASRSNKSADFFNTISPTLTLHSHWRQALNRNSAVYLSRSKACDLRSSKLQSLAEAWRRKSANCGKIPQS